MRLTPSKTCAWRSISPGVTSLPPTSMTRAASAAGMAGAMRAIFPSSTAISWMPSSALDGSTTRPPLSTRSNMTPPLAEGLTADDLHAVGSRGRRALLPGPRGGEMERHRARSAREEDEGLLLAGARHARRLFRRGGEGLAPQELDGGGIGPVHRP